MCRELFSVYDPASQVFSIAIIMAMLVRILGVGMVWFEVILEKKNACKIVF
jgi:hypothetical protein